MYKPHAVCRACRLGATGAPGIKSANPQDRLIPVMDYGVRPLANDFRREQEERAGFAPLEVLFCPRCHLAQLSVVVRPEILYKDYPYVTSNTQTMLDHFKKLYLQIGSELQAPPNSVLEIGSNDGRLLKFLKDQGVRTVRGVDPDPKLCEVATTNGCLSVPAFWPDYQDTNRYDVIIARHVFCHVDDWFGFVARASELMHDNSVLWIEAPYVQAVLDKCQVDTIYHEHLSYLNLLAIEHLLKETDLVLSHVEHYALHGGCVGLVIRKNKYTAMEIPDENLSVSRWRSCFDRSIALRDNLFQLVYDLQDQKKTICGYGASAKSSFWVQACQWTRKNIAFICDDTKAKWFRTSPGTDIPILDEGALLREMPNYAVNFAWNYLPETIRRQDLWIQKGGKFIAPLPEVRVLP